MLAEGLQFNQTSPPVAVLLIGQENAGKLAVDPNIEIEVEAAEIMSGVAHESLLGAGAPQSNAAIVAQSSSQVVSQQ